MIRLHRAVHLTDRESEIVQLISHGLSAKEAAMELGIAPCTIERHVENVRLKTGTRNRVHMVAHVLKSGLLGDLQLSQGPVG